MSVIGSDSRQITTSFGTFPLSTVAAIDIQYISTSLITGEVRIRNRIGSGIVIAPNHVLTAGHNTYRQKKADNLRATTSANQNELRSRAINDAPGDPGANVTYVNFLSDYNATRSLDDDIALLTTSNTLMPASNVIGLIAFVAPETARGLSIDTAGYPGDNVPNSVPPKFNNPGISGNSGRPGRDLVRSPGEAESPGKIVDTSSNRRFFYSPNVDTFRGQSGSGVIHTLNGDSVARVLGVHSQGVSSDNRFLSNVFGRRNSGVLITKDIYDEIMNQIASDSGTENADELPENVIIGSEPGFLSFLTRFFPFLNRRGDDEIFGSYRRERILGEGGDDKLFGGGANDRLEGGKGVDQALFTDIFTNYEFTILDPVNPAFEFRHTGGSQIDGTDTTKDIEFGVFEFVDLLNEDGDNTPDGQDDDLNLFFVPLQVDPNDNTKLKDGPLITPETDVLNDQGNKLGTITVESPAWMFDGDVDYTLTIGSEQGEIFNFAFIIDTSGSMDELPLIQTKIAFKELTRSLDANGFGATSQFAVVEFNSAAGGYAPLDTTDIIPVIDSLQAGGYTNFNAALLEASRYFDSPFRYNNATNIAYFLSDGEPNTGGDYALSANRLKSLAEVRAFGIGNANLSTLNIIDSGGDAVLLQNAGDLFNEFNAPSIDKDTIDRIDVKLAGQVIDTITPDQLSEDDMNLTFEGTIDGLEVTRTTENEITFELVFNDGTPTAFLDYKITTGQEQVREQTNDGTKEVIIFSVNQADFTGSPESAFIEREVIANELDNIIEVQSGENTLFGNGGDDRFVISCGINLVDGGEGIDTVEVDRTQAEAGEVSKNGNVVNIGTDNTLLNIEFIEFSDVRLAVDTLAITPTLSLTDTGILVAEGDTGSTTATFTVNLSSITPEDIVIDFTTRSDDAEAGTDFIGKTGQLTIAAGESAGDITLEILGDTDIEGDEAVFLDLDVVSNGTFANGALTQTVGVNIIDNDHAISLPITGDDPTIIEGNPDTPSTLTLTLDRFGGVSESDTVEVKIVAAGNNPAQASDFVNGFSASQVTFAPGEYTKTVEIAIAPDREVETDETFGV